MANTFLLKIVTPSKDVYSGEIQRILLKSIDGQFEILAGHESMVVSTVPYAAKFIDAEGKEHRIFISTSVASISNGELNICSDAAELPNEIDFERAEKAKQRAEEKMTQRDKYDYENEKLSLARATERLKLK